MVSTSLLLLSSTYIILSDVSFLKHSSLTNLTKRFPERSLRIGVVLSILFHYIRQIFISETKTKDPSYSSLLKELSLTR